MAVALIAGYRSYGSEFSSNLLAEVAGITTSIVIGFALVDRLIEIENKRKWERVSNYLTRGIMFHLYEMHFLLMASAAMFARDLAVDDEDDEVATDLASRFRSFAKYVSENTDTLMHLHDDEQIIISDEDGLFDSDEGYMVRTVSEGDGAPPIHYAPNERVAGIIRKKLQDEQSAESIYHPLKPHVRTLRDVFTPRVLEFGYEPELVEALVVVEEAEEHWASTLRLIKDEWDIPEESGWLAAAGLLEACAALAECVQPKLGGAISSGRIGYAITAEDLQ
ncbi:hypothetical protein ACWDRB_60560 [Nonomuraea sp. NPDC003707]